MVSVKQLANCMGLSGQISIVRDFFGYAFHGYQGTLSLREQVGLVQGKHIHLNLIRVGIENFTDAHEREIDFALQRMRKIYAVPTVQLGVGRVQRYYITEAQAQDMCITSSVLTEDNAKEITDKYSVFNDALDVFFVLEWGDSDTFGRSDVDGSCDKTYDLFYMTGCVVSIETKRARTARTLAHEVGHYLGLPHPSSFFPQPPLGVLDSINPYNLMHQGGTVADAGIDPVDAVELSVFQGSIMREHCFVKRGC